MIFRRCHKARRTRRLRRARCQRNETRMCRNAWSTNGHRPDDRNRALYSLVWRPGMTPFHGHRTASGERFNMYALTAAHRTLPLGTRVKVAHVLGGRSAIVRIDDHGPYCMVASSICQWRRR
ncbi:septal ring lytic transglycosylase RlpA family protein [Burkholderia ubonensis]|uniref:septal ring lytic transglycosylase RlpA family protein n=1 Tax=Burkholderia ubonensis TaxID=101571 RepID=UPI0039F4F03F